MALEDTNILELKKLIEESKEKLKLKAYALSQVKEELSLKRKEIAKAEVNLLRFKPSKIFTRKEIENIKKEKMEKKRKEFETLKLNISSETRKEFEKAKEIRRNILDGNKKEVKAAEDMAHKIEIKALKREIYVLGCILSEKTKAYQDLLVEKVCQENNLNKLKKILDPGSKIEFDCIKSKVKNLTEKCWNSKKELQDLNFKIEKSRFEIKKRLNLSEIV